MNLEYRASATFWESFEALPDDVKKTAIRQFGYFKENPRHPSLKTREMEGMRGEVYEGHIKRGWVFVFRYTEDKTAVESLLCGKHDETYAKAKRMGY